MTIAEFNVTSKACDKRESAIIKISATKGRHPVLH